MPYSKFNIYTINDCSEYEVSISEDGNLIIAFHDIVDQNGKYITLATDGIDVWNLYTGEKVDGEIKKKLIRKYQILSIEYKK